MPTYTPIDPGTKPWGALLNAILATFSSAIDAKAADSATVHKTGDESISGIKTFSSKPVVPDSSFSIAKVTGLQGVLDALQTKFARTTAVYTTPSLIAGARQAATLPLGNEYTLSKIQLSGPARFRLYATIAQRTADTSRGATLPTGDHGLMFEYTSTGAETFTLPPGLVCSNFESSINAPFLIDNTGTSAAAITVTLTYKRTE